MRLLNNAPLTHLNYILHWISLGCTDDWAAVTKWTDEYLSSKLEDTEVTVAITPNGLADAICDGQFTLPFEKSVT